MMYRKNDIEIGFDEEVREYWAIWRPPAAVGSGKFIGEALRDLREVVSFCMDDLIGRKLRETEMGGSKGDGKQNRT
jgi:hypothetical protein